jgi:OmpA-OmpF porin, OOP family
MTLRRSLARANFAALALLLTTTAVAQQNSGFALDRFEPSERGSDWFVLESLDLRGHQRFATGLVLDYAYRPLVIFTADGEDEQSAIVRHQLFGHLGGNVILWERVRFGVNLPIAIFQDGEGGSAAGTVFDSPQHATTVGDLRVSGDVRFAGTYGGPITLAGGLQLFAPIGEQDSFTSDGAVRAVPRLMIAGDAGQMTYAAHLGVAIRARDDAFAGSALGSELTYAAAIGARLDEKRLVIGPELHGTTVVTDSDSFFGRATSPLELIVGGHYQATRVWRVGAGAGPGLTRAFGTPSLRLLATVEWVEPFDEPKPPPPPLPKDRDGDGVLDGEDACPDVPGVRTDDPATNGCPAPKDRDGDGILDPVDACPDVPGVKNEDPKKHGCPPADRDKDGILDDDDACPDEPGVKTDDPKTNGCPPPKDRDGDGILDTEDACPDVPGEKNEDPKKNGCPVARVEKGQIIIREQVQFAYNSAKILKTSDYILEAVKKILDENPEIKHVNIEGHTDSKGGDAYNKALSGRRAASVVAWLVQHGVDKKRLAPKGFGEERPIDSNDTEDGRANNRRVEFHIVEQDPAKAP